MCVGFLFGNFDKTPYMAIKGGGGGHPEPPFIWVYTPASGFRGKLTLPPWSHEFEVSPLPRPPHSLKVNPTTMYGWTH
jgi:hypothetical protein